MIQIKYMKEDEKFEKKYRELSKKYDTIHKRLLKIKPLFDKKLKKIAFENHADVVIVPLKSKKRTIQKTLAEYSGNINNVKDFLRAGIVSRVYGRVDEILENIKENFEIIRIKDRFKKPDKSHYRDVLINVKFQGIIAEIQIHVRELLEVKEYLNHLFYEIRRYILAQSKRRNRDIFSWENHILYEVKEIETYSNSQAWYRQISEEKGEDPNKMIFMITSNSEKFKEAKSFIPTLKRIDINLPEIQSFNSKDIVIEKMKEALKTVDGKLIVEDTSFYCEGLKGLPGPFNNKFVLDKIGIANLAKMIIATKNIKAKTISYVCFKDSSNRFHIFEGITKGTVVLPRGYNPKSSFKWDSIFQPDGFSKTYSQMSLSEKNDISMRGKSFDKLVKFLHKKYKFAL